MPSRPRKRISSAVSRVDIGIAVDVAPGVEARRMPRLQRQAQVLVDRQAAEQVGDLERAGEALLADAVRRRGRGSRRPFRRTRAARPARNRPDTRLNRVVLPAPFGPISAWIFARLDREARVRDGADAAEVLRDARRPRSTVPCRAPRAQERRQRQALVDLALAHRGRFLRRRAPAPRSVAQMPTRPLGRVQHEADEDEAEPEQPVRGPDREQLAEQDVEQDAERPARGCGACRRSPPSPAARRRRRPSRPPPRRGSSGSRAARRRARSPPPRARTPPACSARPDSPGTWRAAGSRGSPPARGRTASASTRSSTYSTPSPISATTM